MSSREYARGAIVLSSLLIASGCGHRPLDELSAAAPAARGGWVETWAPSQSATAPRPAAGTPDAVPTYARATIREIIHTTVGGDRVRIRISNEYGDRPITIGAAHIALHAQGPATVPGSDRPLTFGGSRSVTVRTGAVAVSDPVAFDVPVLGDLVVSLYLPDSARTTTRHALGVQTTYVSKAGDLSAATAFSADTTLRSWIYLAAVEVTNPRVTGTIVAIGNSITDGFAATVDANRRWPDVLAQRLLTSSTEPPKAVVNSGISGNRVLTFGAGPSLMSRFDRDALMIKGVTHIIVLEGINDISRSNIDPVTAEDITFAYRQLIDRAHERGIMIYGATLTPFDRAPAENEAKRQAVNQWIRNSRAFDGVIDFDAVTRDPAQPNRLLPAYDSGDHLHPSDAGYRAMGESIDLALFRGSRSAALR